eukprot:373388-Pyramimonas_sp.AAC.1
MSGRKRCPGAGVSSVERRGIKRAARGSTVRVPLVATPLSSRMPLAAASDPTTLDRLRIPLTQIIPAYVRLTQVPLIAGALSSRL